MLVSGDISTIELQGRLERATEDMSVKNQEVEDDMNALLFVCYNSSLYLLIFTRSRFLHYSDVACN